MNFNFSLAYHFKFWIGFDYNYYLNFFIFLIVNQLTKKKQGTQGYEFLKSYFFENETLSHFVWFILDLFAL